MSSLVLRILAPLAVAATTPFSALAHATFEAKEVSANTTQRMVLRVPHGCKGQPTNAVRIDIPDGVVGVKPMPKAGWTLDTINGPLARPYESHGRQITDGVKRIIWSGGNLPDGFYDEFIFTAQFTEGLPTGKPVYLPVVQTCPKGEAAWTQIPLEGQSAKLESPAPGVRVVAQAGGGVAMPVSSTMSVEQVWTRATPGGAKVAGGFMRLTNTGKEADRLVSASASISNTVEIHEMKHEGGMMKMRALEKGLEIKPGETIELKPGSYHVMFIDLKAPIKEGDSFKGELVFEKAGKVSVDFKAAPMGGSPAPANAHQHGH